MTKGIRYLILEGELSESYFASGSAGDLMPVGEYPGVYGHTRSPPRWETLPRPCGRSIAALQRHLTRSITENPCLGCTNQ